MMRITRLAIGAFWVLLAVLFLVMVVFPFVVNFLVP